MRDLVKHPTEPDESFPHFPLRHPVLDTGPIQITHKFFYHAGLARDPINHSTEPDESFLHFPLRHPVLDTGPIQITHKFFYHAGFARDLTLGILCNNTNKVRKNKWEHNTKHLTIPK